MKSVLQVALIGFLSLAGISGLSAQSSNSNRPQKNLDNNTEKPPTQNEKQFPLGASWVAVSLNGRALNGDRPTMQLDPNMRARGFGGCNTYSVTAYPLRRQGFAVGPIALTKRACDKNLMELERSYLTALRTSQVWDLSRGQLVIKGQAGEIRFDRGL
jgi:heat shock protein HslJ